jgi:hypothetical protein
MQVLPVYRASAGKMPRAQSRVRILFGVGLGALALAGITAATALPSHTTRQPSAAEQKPEPSSVPYLGAGAERPKLLPSEADPHARRFTGAIGSDLTSSLQAAGVPERQGREYVAVLARAIDLAGGLSVDDRFDLVLERRSDGKLGQLLYVGLDRIGRADVELLKWTDGKQLIWVNGDGVGGETNAGVRLPVSGRVTSKFGERFHPILGYARFHKGVDLGASAGTPIVAAADGRVVSAGWHGGYGRQVAIAHAGGMETTYGHMSRIAARAGELVRQGQVIGYVGSSGLSTGPHLHFEVSLNGRPVNPLSVKLKGGPAHLQGEKLHVFQDQLRDLLLLQTS